MPFMHRVAFRIYIILTYQKKNYLYFFQILLLDYSILNFFSYAMLSYHLSQTLRLLENGEFNHIILTVIVELPLFFSNFIIRL